MIQTLAPYGALLMAFTVEWYVTHHTSSFLLLLFGPFSPVVWLIPLYILRTMFGHIYFTVVFHLSPVVRGPACSFITARIWDVGEISIYTQIHQLVYVLWN